MDGLTTRPGSRRAAACALRLCLLLACGIAGMAPGFASSTTTFHTDPSGGTVTTTTKTDADGNTTVIRTTTRKDASGNPLTTTVTTDPNGDTTTVVRQVGDGGSIVTTTTHALAGGDVDDEEIVVTTATGRVLRREHRKWEGGRLTPDQKPSWQTVIVGVKAADDGEKAPPDKASPVKAPPDKPVPAGPVTGLLVVDLPTPRGMVRVNLPADLAAGDTVSGTFILEPDGATPDEQDKNTDELSSYLIDFAGQRLVTGNGWGKWTIPARATSDPMILRDGHGAELARSVIAIMPGDKANVETADYVAAPPPARFRLPVIGQAGRPLVIRGPFRWDLAIISIKVGGEELPALAVSPRQAVVRSPRGVIGPTTLEVNEGTFFSKGVFRNITCELSAEKTTLTSGEQTPLTLTVRGLRGLSQPVSLVLTNKSPGVVRFANGDTRTVEIKPPAVASDGTYTVQVPLTGIQSGEFAITVSLAGNSM